MKITKELKDDIRSTIGEGVHTSLRKYCESKEAHNAWIAIDKMPNGEWGNVCDVVADVLVEIIKSHERKQREAVKK